MKSATRIGVCFLAGAVAGCGSPDDSSSPSRDSGASQDGSSPGFDAGPDQRPAAQDCIPAGVDNSTPFSMTYRVKHIGDTSFEGKPYAIVSSMPWTYTLPAVQCGKTFPIVEADTHYIVDSNFELPYI